ncbi:MAG: S41 family peptidase [Chloroflexi bacterium]|nr:S41 family peptidase [Chloroflexota bacterium]
MKNKTYSGFLSLLLVILAFGAGYYVGQSPLAPIAFFGAASTTPEAAKESFAPFWEVWDLVHNRYYQQPVDDVVLTKGAIDGMLATLDDPHTRYLAPEDEEAARDTMSGEFQGIGAEVEAVDQDIVVVSPIEGSPAEAAGLQPGDILRQADGVDLTGMDVYEAAQLVRGPAGTAVHLLIERDGESFELEIVRDYVALKSVRSEMLDGNIAYVRLSRFGNQSGEEMEEALTEVMAANPVGLILDLRRNPGGSLDTAVSVADQFLPEGVILREQFGNDSERLYESTDKGLAENIPLVVLIDEGSASASEVLAGAIRDDGRGILIGQTSYGKGTVQTWQGLSNGGGVRLTIARWLTPNQTWIHGTGLEPDYFIPLPDVDTTSGQEFVDTQRQAAIEYLLGEKIISVPPIVEPEG